MRNLLILCWLTVSAVLPVTAQELNCTIEINDDQVRNTDPQLMNNLRQAISDFMNNRRWTNDNFAPEERIRCNMVISLLSNGTDVAAGRYEANVRISSTRPVYNTDYQSLVFSYFDQSWNFSYNPMQPMDFNPNSYFSSLTSLLAYYAYLIVGMDYDSFAKGAGAPYFATAQEVALNAGQNGAGPGWQSFDGTNSRFFLADNLVNQQFTPFREGLYNYYRQGLDVMLDNPDQARTNALDLLQKAKVAREQNPLSVLLNIFFEAKDNELVSLFMEAPPQQKQQVYQLLVELDPTQTDRYAPLTQ